MKNRSLTTSRKAARFSSKLWLPLLAGVGALGFAGCGGGGGGSSPLSSAPPPSQTASAVVGVFATDSFSEAYDHVWVTIHQVEVESSNGTAQTVFDDAQGKTIDLKTLRDATGQRFALLGAGKIDASTATGIKVTIDNSVLLFPAGASSGQATPVDDAVAHDGQGHAVLSFPLTAPRSLGSGHDDLVVDFDLADFTVSGGKVRPVVKEGAKAGLDDPSRHEREEYKGVLSQLSGASPAFTFTLTREGSTISVVTDAQTTFFNADGTPNPKLAEGQTVAVRGLFDVPAQRLTASEVKIRPAGGEQEPAEVEGVPGAVNAGAGTFTLTAHQVERLVPMQTTVNIVTGSSTVFRAKGGITLTAADFFAGLATAQAVEVEGTYDAASNTLTATRAKLENEAEGGHGGGAGGGAGGGDHGGAASGVEAEGNATAIDASANTFLLASPSEWEGFVPASGGVSVVTTASTVYGDGAGGALTAPQFFAGLAASPQVKVRGTLAGATVTASELTLHGEKHGKG